MPKTPTRNRNRNGQSSLPVIESPYFSPLKTPPSKDSASLVSPLRVRLFELPDDTGILLPNSYHERPTVTVHGDYDFPKDRNEESLQDPLSCFYTRAFAQLDNQLCLVKPVLIQETVADYPWKLLVAVTLLNKTSGKLAIPVFWNIIAKWPTPFELSQADEPELTSIIRHLGTQSIRAKRLILLSKTYLLDPPSTHDPRPSRHALGASIIMTPQPLSRKRKRYPATPISHLPGTGPYALDSYRIFCTPDQWKLVLPSDKELIRYLKWKWALFEHIEWSPISGIIGPASLSYLRGLVSDLSPEKA